jgi:hypothetical protein
MPIWLLEGKPNVIRRLPKTPGAQLEIARPKGQTRFHKLNPNRRKLCNTGSAETGYTEASGRVADSIPLAFWSKAAVQAQDGCVLSRFPKQPL